MDSNCHLGRPATKDGYRTSVTRVRGHDLIGKCMFAQYIFGVHTQCSSCKLSTLMKKRIPMRTKRCCAFADGCAAKTGPGVVRRLTNCTLTSTLQSTRTCASVMYIFQSNACLNKGLWRACIIMRWWWHSRQCCKLNQSLESRVKAR